MKTNAVLLLILLSLCFSCKNAYRELQPSEMPQSHDLKSVFYGQERAFAYDTGVRFRSNYVSGLLFIKPLAEEKYRIAMTTKMGQKIFDFSLDKETFTVNYCVEQLNRKIVLNLLEKDLHLLTDSYLNTKPVAVFEDAENQKIYRLKPGKNYLHYYYNSADQLVRIENGTKRKPKLMAKLGDYQNGFPHTIHLDHNLLFNLELDLKWVELNK